MNRYRLAALVIALGLCLPALGHNIQIEHHEIPLEIDTYGRYRQNQSLFMWTPFDSMRTHWDLTNYQGGRWTRTGLRDYDEGRYPAPESMEVDPPDPDVVSMDTLGNNSEQWTYFYKNEFGLYLDGIDFSQLTYRFIGNYLPDAPVYVTPMYRGAGWLSAISWQYEIIPGIPYQASEQHTKRIVARGKVRVPMSGDYYWPCLVIRDYSVFTDNLGSEDRRWMYEWVVPGHFAGGNGVAAAQSQNGASEDFINVENFFALSQLDVPDWDLIPPTFANTRVWPDTGYEGPFCVWSDITDDDGVGLESLCYRVDNGAWQAVGSDSSDGDTYFFTIPQVSGPATVDYYIWAMDDFCELEEIDCWTTWPVCSPESTMITFEVTATGVAEPGRAPGTGRLLVAPNPAPGATRISLAAPGLAYAVCRIYEPTGRLVRTLAMTGRNGTLETAWDGRDESGRELSAGAYPFAVSGPLFARTGKVTLNR